MVNTYSRVQTTHSATLKLNKYAHQPRTNAHQRQRIPLTPRSNGPEIPQRRNPRPSWPLAVAHQRLTPATLPLPSFTGFASTTPPSSSINSVSARPRGFRNANSIPSLSDRASLLPLINRRARDLFCSRLPSSWFAHF